MRKLDVIMAGPAIEVQGGISTIIHEYLKADIEKKVSLTLVPTLRDGPKLYKCLVFLKAFFQYSIALVRTRRPVVHLHLSQDGSFVRKLMLFTLASLSGAKTAVQLHGSRFEKFMHRNWLTTRLTRYMFDNATIILVGSDLWQQKLKEFSRNQNIITFYNPIEITEHRRSNNETIDVLFLGRLGERKGIYDLIETIANKEDYFRQKKVRFILAGDGDVDKVRSIVSSKSWSDFVEVPGWIAGDDKLELLRYCDILTLPSYNEQMPMSVLEGMSFGYPIVASDVAGIPEMVESGRNGFLFKPGQIDRLTEAIVALCDDEELRNRMGTASREIVAQKFEGHIVVDNLVEIYASLYDQE